MNINDIITESQQKCPHCGGPLMEYSDLMEKKDACYYKVKASAKVWPSAYASGRLVQCRKKGAGNYGNKSESVAEGESNDTAISLSKLGKFHPGADTLAEFVPERATAQYALHPDKWESTFYSLTNKDSDKLKYYGPKKISIPPGTLVGDMAIANKFYRAKTPEEQEQYAELYKASLQPYPVDVSEYRMPELLIPKQDVAEDKGMTQYNAFKREWRAKHGSDAKVPGYDSKEYNAYWWRQGDKKQGVSEGARQGEYGRVLTALGLYYPEKFSMEELNTPDWHRVIANKADVSVEYAGQVIDDFTQPDDDKYNEEQDLSTDQQFDMIEDMVEHLAKSHGVDSDEIWEDFESVDDHELFETAAWRRKEGKSARGGLNAKGVASYRRENPGSKLQTAVTTKPSKLKPGSKAAKRRKSFCARMGGVKGPMKKPNGKPTRKALALRKWNC
jgi:hypothetical protein